MMTAKKQLPFRFAAATVAFLLLLAGCSPSIRYGGTDASGRDAAEIVREYYRLFVGNEDRQRNKEDAYLLTEHYRPDDATYVYQDITLRKLSRCEMIDESTSPGDFKSRQREFREKGYYAFCLVQTSDTVFCEEDGATGLKGEIVTRNYGYTLVMETEDSNWKIYDSGYPPFCLPETDTSTT